MMIKSTLLAGALAVTLLAACGKKEDETQRDVVIVPPVVTQPAPAPQPAPPVVVPTPAPAPMPAPSGDTTVVTPATDGAATATPSTDAAEGNGGYDNSKK